MFDIDCEKLLCENNTELCVVVRNLQVLISLACVQSLLHSSYNSNSIVPLLYSLSNARIT